MSVSAIEDSSKTEKTSVTSAPLKASPWEILDHQPGALKTKGGNKLLTLEDALKKPNSGTFSKQQNNLSSQTRNDSTSIPVKREDEEKWNPVDLTHLLITDAEPKSGRNSSGRFKNANGGSKRKQSPKSDKNKSNNSSKREGKDKIVRGENKKQSDEKASTSKLNNSAKQEYSKSSKYTAPNTLANDEKSYSKEEPVEEEPSSSENEVESEGTENKKEGRESKKETEATYSNGDYKPSISPNYKGNKPVYDGFKKFQRKPYNPNHRYNQSGEHYSSDNRKPYEKRPYQSRSYNTRYNNSYQNRGYSNNQQTPIILPIYQKQFSYAVYNECSKQIAYYLSIENLEKDEYLVKNLMDKTGYVQLSRLLSFKKLKQLSDNGNFEIVMTAIFIILSQQLESTNDIEVALLDNQSEFIETDAYGNKNPYDCYILRNLQWTNTDETNPRVFTPVTAFGVNDFISYSIQKPFEEEEKGTDATESSNK